MDESRTFPPFVHGAARLQHTGGAVGKGWVSPALKRVQALMESCTPSSYYKSHENNMLYTGSILGNPDIAEYLPYSVAGLGRSLADRSVQTFDPRIRLTQNHRAHAVGRDALTRILIFGAPPLKRQLTHKWQSTISSLQVSILHVFAFSWTKVA